MIKSTTLPGKREIQRQANKDKLYGAMSYFLDHKQYDNVRVRNICNQAGLKTSSFYNLYGSFDIFIFNYLADSFYAYLKTEHNLIQKSKGLSGICVLYMLFDDFFYEKKGIVFTHFFMTNYASSLSLVNYMKLDNDSVRAIKIKSREFYQEAVDMKEIKSSYDPTLIFTYLDCVASGSLYTWCNMDGKVSLHELNYFLISEFFKNQLTDNYYKMLKKTFL
jgi:hypothetical protein